MEITDCGGLLKKITLWVLIIGLVAVVIILISTVAPLAEYDSEAADQAIGAAWLSAGISAAGMCVTGVVRYALGGVGQKAAAIAANTQKKK